MTAEARSATYLRHRGPLRIDRTRGMRPSAMPLLCDFFASYSAHAGGEYDMIIVSLGKPARQPRRSNVDQLRPGDHGIGEQGCLNVARRGVGANGAPPAICVLRWLNWQLWQVEKMAPDREVADVSRLPTRTPDADLAATFSNFCFCFCLCF